MNINVSFSAIDVLIERDRQITEKEWTPEHDDEHTDGSLAQAAACYAILSVYKFYPEPTPDAPSKKYYIAQLSASLWPWRGRPNGKDHRSNCVRAAALLIAEIERIDRAAASNPVPSSDARRDSDSD